MMKWELNELNRLPRQARRVLRPSKCSAHLLFPLKHLERQAWIPDLEPFFHFESRQHGLEAHVMNVSSTRKSKATLKVLCAAA
jgi:hypothetical protein